VKTLASPQATRSFLHETVDETLLKIDMRDES
jgi:hypothetical protein